LGQGYLQLKNKDPQGLQLRYFAKGISINFYQDCASYRPGVKIGPAQEIIDFHYVHHSFESLYMYHNYAFT
jgi:hypothetical protein